MKQITEQRQIDIQRALRLMPWWAKEKARRYKEQKKFAEKLFGPVVKYLYDQQKAK